MKRREDEFRAGFLFDEHGEGALDRKLSMAAINAADAAAVAIKRAIEARLKKQRKLPQNA